MQKTQPDQWSSRAVTSTLQVSIYNRNSGLVYSPNCGFGWRFGIHGTVEATNYWASVSSPPDHQQVSRLRLCFDPNLIANATFGDVTIAVRSTCDDALVPDQFSSTSKSPQSSRSILRSCKLPGFRIQLGTYQFATDFVLPIVFHITVSFAESLDLDLRPSPSTSVAKALRDSIIGVEIVDIKFVLFSTRSTSGIKGNSKPLYASTHILQGHSADLDALLSNLGFKESAIVSLDDETSLEADDTGLYDYDSDSDLDPDEEPPVDKVPDRRPPSSSSSALDAANDPSMRPRRSGRVFPIRDIAYRTWRSFLYHLYGETITFTSLKSSQMVATPANHVVACSPKSMYRLADKYGLEDLAGLAKTAIEDRLLEDNIVEELFSSLTCRYDEILQMEVAFLGSYCDSPIVSKAFGNALDRLAAGELPGRAGVLKAIYQNLFPGRF